MNLFHKFSAALAAASLAAALLLCGIFFSFQRRTVQGAQAARLETMAQAAAAMLREAELAADPLMAVDYLSGLCSSRPELASCELDIGRGLRPVKVRGRNLPAAAQGTVRKEIKGGRFSARLNFSTGALDQERRAAMAGIYRDLAAAFLAAAAASSS